MNEAEARWNEVEAEDSCSEAEAEAKARFSVGRESLEDYCQMATKLARQSIFTYAYHS